MVDTNKKLPKHGWDDEEIVPKYGTIYGQRDLLGRQELYYSNPAEPENYSYQKFDPSGSYETLQKDKDKNEIRTTLHTGERRGYTAGSSSENTDGHKDVKIESTSRKDVTGDDSTAAKRTFALHQEGKVETSGGYSQNFTVDSMKASPLAMTKSFSGTDGDQVNEHSGNWHEAFEKDHVQAVSANKITMVEGGDYAVHVQSGNYDNHIAEKGRMYTGNDLLLESATKITLKVGGSTIEITSGSIKMISPRIDLN